MMQASTFEKAKRLDESIKLKIRIRGRKRVEIELL